DLRWLEPLFETLESLDEMLSGQGDVDVAVGRVGFQDQGARCSTEILLQAVDKGHARSSPANGNTNARSSRPTRPSAARAACMARPLVMPRDVAPRTSGASCSSSHRPRAGCIVDRMASALETALQKALSVRLNLQISLSKLPIIEEWMDIH